MFTVLLPAKTVTGCGVVHEREAEMLSTHKSGNQINTRKCKKKKKVSANKKQPGSRDLTERESETQQIYQH